MRAAFAAFAALLCTGCVVVGSDEPLFGAADAGTPQLRSGVWSMPHDKCEFDPAVPAADWPSCANPTIVRPGSMLGGFGDKDGPQTLGFVLAAGDPQVLQVEAPADRKPNEPRYVFAGLRALELDEQGRAVGVRVWLALCFMPPMKADAPEPKPFPGLTLKQGDSYCRASSPGPVREAVRRSERVELDGEAIQLTARWIRDGER